MNGLAKNARRRGGSAIWALVIGCVLTGLLARASWQQAKARDQERFNNMTEQFRQEFETRVERYELGLLHLAEWLGENELASTAEWDQRIERMNLRVNFPGVTSVYYAPALHSSNKTRWLGRAPAHWPQPDEWEDWSFPVWYETFSSNVAELSWGRKLRDELFIFSSKYWVVGTAGFVASEKFYVTNSGGARLPAFALVTGAFRKPAIGAEIPADGFQRRMEVVAGALGATICIEPLLESIFGGRKLEIDYEVHAGSASPANRMNNLGRPPLTPGQGGLHAELEIPWYYNRWTLVTKANKLFHSHSHRNRAWQVAGGGLLLTLSVAWALRVQEKARAEAVSWGTSLENAREELRVALKERLRLGRNLHDGALQSMYAAALGLKRARRAVETQPAQAKATIEAAGAELESAMESIRRFLSNSPQDCAAPEQLPALLDGFATAFTRIQGSRVDLKIEEGAARSLTGEQAEQLLHVAREAVSNAHRHGRAQAILITLRKEGAEAFLRVEDDGIGFDGAVDPSAGHGLRFMGERAAICGGALSVQSRPGGPTCIEVKFGVNESARP